MVLVRGEIVRRSGLRDPLRVGQPGGAEERSEAPDLRRCRVRTRPIAGVIAFPRY